MSYGVPATESNRALASVIGRRIKSDASMIAATATFWRLLGIGGLCLLVGIGLAAAFFGYSYITDSRSSMEKLSEAMANGLNKVVLKVADLKGNVALTDGGTVRLADGGSVRLDTNGALVRLDSNGAVVRLDAGGTSLRPTERQLNTSAKPASNAPVVTNFTVFKQTTFGDGTITTGWNYESSTDASPVHQYCYYTAPTNAGVWVRYDLGTDGVPVASHNYPINFEAALSDCVWYR